MTALAGFWLGGLLFALAGSPLALRLFSGLPDKGLGLLRPFGLLAVTYLSWIFGMVLPAGGPSLAAALLSCLILFLLSWKGAIKPLWEDPKFRGDAVKYEILGLGAFLFFAWARSHYPDITATEKMMDLGLLNGMGKATHYPPQNPWLAGHKMTYYYFGYLSWATLNKIAGAPGGLAFNLALASVFAQAFVAALSLGRNLTGRWSLGWLSGLAATVLGNLAGALWIFRAGTLFPGEGGNPDPTGGGWHWWWFRAARVMSVGAGKEDLITEFPGFSFVLGDLHPHVMAIPTFIMVLGLGLSLLLKGLKDGYPFGGGSWKWILLAAAGLCWGSAGVANAWDLPTLGLVLAFCLWMGMAGGAGRDIVWADHLVPPSLKGLPGLGLLASPSGAALLRVGAAGAAGIILFMPYWHGFHSQAGGMSLVRGERTRLTDFCLIFGLFLVPVLAFARTRLLRSAAAVPSAKKGGCPRCGAAPRGGARFCHACGQPLGVAGGGAGAAGLRLGLEAPAWLSSPALGWAALLAGLALLGLEIWAWPNSRGQWRLFTGALSLGLALAFFLSLLRGQDRAEEAFASLAAGTAFLLIFGCEFFLLRDVFYSNGEGLSRMNTVFKLQFQAWLLLSLVLPVALASLGRGYAGAWRRGLGGAFAFLLLLSSLYLPAASQGRDRERRGFGTSLGLDGSLFKERFDPGDYDAAMTLARVPGDPVIMEAPTWMQYHEDYARISAYSGLPTVVGWGGHVHQWTGNSDEVGAAIAEVQEAYRAESQARVEELLRKHKVRFVIIGPTERRDFKTPDLERLASWLRPYHDNRDRFGDKGTVVLEVPWPAGS